MGGMLCVLAGNSGVSGLSVTDGTESVFDPKSGVTTAMYGYANSSNSISGGTVGAVSPTTYLGATINAIYFIDNGSAPGSLRFILNGDQRAKTITSIIINGSTYTMSAASFSGGQTTWSAASSVGDNWGSSPFARII